MSFGDKAILYIPSHLAYGAWCRKRNSYADIIF
jgi:FKBP-type peptidyl-prolyl cis-trans isomerase